MRIKSLLMVRPLSFGFNPETAESNAFQKNITVPDASKKALKEFDNFVETLRTSHVPVKVFEDLPDTHLPDSIFPNNWFSTHPGGIIHVYPMFNESRKGEVRSDILQALQTDFGYNTINDYRNGQGICEGTGSIVFDHENKLGYAVLSPRTDKNLTEKIIRSLKYTPVFLEASIENKPIYHTNVFMCNAPEFMLVCLDVLSLKSMETFIKNTPEDKEVLPITVGQMNTFAGNMLAVDTKTDKFIIMSETARKSLMKNQLYYIEQHRKIISVDIPTIEALGGGSVRCMLAEIF